MSVPYTQPVTPQPVVPPISTDTVLTRVTVYEKSSGFYTGKRSVVSLLTVSMLVLGLFLPLTVTIRASLAAPNTVITVNSLSDDPTVCAASKTICLRDAITAAITKSTPVTITFSVSGHVTIDSRFLIQNKSTNALTIDGTGEDISINGDDQSQLFELYPNAQLTLSHLDLTAGYAIVGGAIYNAGTLTLVNSTVHDNNSTEAGGALYNLGAMTIDNSTIENNDSIRGGGIYSGTSHVLTIINSIFDQNTGTLGGGLATYQGQITISDSTFGGNSAVRGGAIFSESDGHLSITNSTLSGNSATIGGALSNRTRSNATITSSTLSGNSATTGGAIDNESAAILTVSNSTLSNNDAGSGGGFYQSGTSNATFSNSTVFGNTASAVAGGLYTESQATLNLLSTIVAGNRLTGPGGTDPDIDGEVTSLGANLIGDATGASGLSLHDYANIANPGLSVLSNNGSPLQVIPLLNNSPALSKGDCSGNTTASPIAPPVTVDQRGVFRKLTGCDIGAFELNKDSSTPTPLAQPTLIPAPKNPTGTPTEVAPNAPSINS